MPRQNYSPEELQYMAGILPNYPPLPYGRGGTANWANVANHMNEYYAPLNPPRNYTQHSVSNAWYRYGDQVAMENPMQYYSVYDGYDANGNLADPNNPGQRLYGVYGSWAEAPHFHGFREAEAYDPNFGYRGPNIPQFF